MTKKIFLLTTVVIIILGLFCNRVNAQRKQRVCDCSLPYYGCKKNDKKCITFCSGCLGWLTSVSVSLNKPMQVSVRVYNATGQLIRTVANENMTEGDHVIEWNKKDETGSDVSAGVYYMQVETSNAFQIKKLLVL